MQKILLWSLLFLGLVGCIDNYTPTVPPRESNLLVVDGFINPAGASTFKLSRTTALTSSEASVEKRAKLLIETASGQQYPLTEVTDGTYTSAPLQFGQGQQVRLRLTTAAGREYASDFTSAQLTPSMDALTWRPRNDKVEILLDTHNELAAARHYRWRYQETWEFYSAFRSLVKYEQRKLVFRQEDIFHCWGNEDASAIVLATTTRLRENRVAEQVVTRVLNTSPKLSRKYSILVTQFAITPEEYDYWEMLRKNTEDIGSLFDPLPTQLTGNVHALADPNEAVLGFVGASSPVQRRLFIDRRELPPSWPVGTGYESCILDTVPRTGAEPYPPQQLFDFFADGALTPVEIDSLKFKIFFGSTDCIDCRRRGTNVKPSFWP